MTPTNRGSAPGVTCACPGQHDQIAVFDLALRESEFEREHLIHALDVTVVIEIDGLLRRQADRRQNFLGKTSSSCG